MTSKISLPRKTLSFDNAKLYTSLGALLKEYRKWRGLSQEAFAESIQISVRELQNWEANRQSARIDNLHDISEITGIPMAPLLALNAEQPIWYSLQKRMFMYYSIEQSHYASLDLFKHSKISEYYSMLKKVIITKDKHIDMFLSCHQDLYGPKILLQRDVIKKAASILPEMNYIILDVWNHYMGHKICLPIKIDTYRNLIKKKTIEDYVTTETINDIIAQNEGVFFCYSALAVNISSASWVILGGIRDLYKIKKKERYLLVNHLVTKESELITKNMGMNFIRDYECELAKSHPAIYEIKLDSFLKSDGPIRYVIEHIDEKLMTKNLTIEKQRPMKIKENRSPSVVGKLPSLVDQLPSTVKENKCYIQHGKKQYIKSKIEVCKNPKCALYGNTEKGTIISNGTYKTKNGTIGRRFQCKECGKSFCIRTGTIFYDIRSPEEKVLCALKLLAKGMPLQHVAKHMEVKFDTIQRWLKVAAKQTEKINSILINEPDISRAELDALWSFVNTNSLRQRAFIYTAKNKSNTTGEES
ncbi:MAG: helix-turn-helix domain-containing protein [Proteobacteria bacterium]|nr:helix-turn-helix domain-containing protein [Pseudomonadota bacterium]